MKPSGIEPACSADPQSTAPPGAQMDVSGQHRATTATAPSNNSGKPLTAVLDDLQKTKIVLFLPGFQTRIVQPASLELTIPGPSWRSPNN